MQIEIQYQTYLQYTNITIILKEVVTPVFWISQMKYIFTLIIAMDLLKICW